MIKLLSKLIGVWYPKGKPFCGCCLAILHKMEPCKEAENNNWSERKQTHLES